MWELLKSMGSSLQNIQRLPRTIRMAATVTASYTKSPICGKWDLQAADAGRETDAVAG
jgi:hypothetical protein